MLRCLRLTTLFLLALAVAGCGSGGSGSAAKKDAGATVSTEEAKQKALQNMPPEIQKKMTQQMQKTKKR
jgi:hypothetical protein